MNSLTKEEGLHEGGSSRITPKLINIGVFSWQLENTYRKFLTILWAYVVGRELLVEGNSK